MTKPDDLLKRHANAVDAYLKQVLARQSASPARLIESMDYSLTAGGKRLRPALVLECFSACAEKQGQGARGEGRGNAEESVSSASSSLTTSSHASSIFAPCPSPLAASHASALAAAGAIELIHTFSLVHDDLPAMDDDDLRRGRPTNHKVYGEAMAILAGDAMVTLAFEIIAADADPKLVPALVRELASASGLVGMIGGQVLDIDGENQNLSLAQLQNLHRMKTGALLTCACRMGAIAAGESERGLAAITEYGRHLGLAFQIVDDMLDVTSTPQQLGKATNKDAGIGKNTYPGLLGLEGSQSAASEQVDLALESLNDFGPSADHLRAVARFVIARQH